MIKNPYFKLHLSIFIYGFTGILGKWILLSEGVLVWYRMGLTALIYLVWLYLRKGLTRISWKQVWEIGFPGIILALHWLTFYGSIKYGTVSVTLVCFSTGPLFTALLTPLFEKKRISRTEIFISCMLTLGVYLIYAFEKVYAIGILLGLVCAVFNAWCSILNKKLVNKYPTALVNTYVIFFGWIFLTVFLPFYLMIGDGIPKLLPTLSDWGYLLILTVVCTNFAYHLTLEAMKHISAFHVMLSLNLEAVYGILLALVLLGENKTINSGFIVGASLIFATVFIYPLLENPVHLRRFQPLKRIFLKRSP